MPTTTEPAPTGSDLLSNEIILQIFCKLSRAELLRGCVRVCRKWAGLVYDRTLWSKLRVSDHGGLSYGAAGFAIPLDACPALLARVPRDAVTCLDVSRVEADWVNLLPLLPSLKCFHLPSPGSCPAGLARAVEQIAERVGTVTRLSIGREADSAVASWSRQLATALARLQQLERLEVLCPTPLESVLAEGGIRSLGTLRELVLRAVAAPGAEGSDEPLASIASHLPDLRRLDVRLEAPDGRSPRAYALRRSRAEPPGPGAGGGSGLLALRQLDELVCGGAGLGATVLECLATRLVRLEAETPASALAISGEGLAVVRLAAPRLDRVALGSCPRLELLALQLHPARELRLAFSEQPPALRELEVPLGRIQRLTLPPGAPPLQLRRLVCGALTDDLVAALEPGALRTLEVAGQSLLSASVLHGRHLAALARFPRLDALSITRCAFDTPVLSFWHPHVYRLRIEGCCAAAPATGAALPARVISSVSIRCPNLRSLQLRLGDRAGAAGADNSSSDEDEGELARGGPAVDSALPDEIDIDCPPSRRRPGSAELVPAPVLFTAAVVECGRLEALEVEGCGFVDDIWIAGFLQRHERLRSLALAACPLRTAFIVSKNLRELSIRNCPRTVGACVMAPRLRTLRLASLPLLAPDVLSSLRDSTPRLAELELSSLLAVRDLTIRCPAALKALSLVDMPRLQRLRIAGTWGLREVGAHSLPSLQGGDMEIPPHAVVSSSGLPRTATFSRRWDSLQHTVPLARQARGEIALPDSAAPSYCGSSLTPFACFRGCLGTRAQLPPPGDVRGLPPVPARLRDPAAFACRDAYAASSASCLLS